jgi:hypothetical protein
MSNTIDAIANLTNQLVKTRLLFEMETIEEQNNPEDISLYDAISQTLGAICAPHELELLSQREISTEWMQTVANA